MLCSLLILIFQVNDDQTFQGKGISKSHAYKNAVTAVLFTVAHGLKPSNEDDTITTIKNDELNIANGLKPSTDDTTTTIKNDELKIETLDNNYLPDFINGLCSGLIFKSSFCNYNNNNNIFTVGVNVSGKYPISITDRRCIYTGLFL